MPLNKVPRLREPRGPIVQQVRDLFLEREFKTNPEHFYLEDVKLIENMDFLLQRYVIMQRKDVEASVKAVTAMLKWRKEKKLYEMNFKQFPQELTIAAGAFIYEPDKYGNRTLYLRASMCKNCTELKASLRDFLTYLMYKLDDPKDGSTYSIIMDLTNTTLTNYDIDLLTHVVALLKDHFPVNMDYFLAINFPWILSAAWSLIKRLIPAERRDAVQFISSDKIFDYVDKENCPDFLGGKCTKPYSFIDQDAPTTIEYLQQNATKSISNKRLREILNLFNETLPKEHLAMLKKQIDNIKDGIKVADTNNNNDDGSDENLNNQKSPPAIIERKEKSRVGKV